MSLTSKPLSLCSQPLAEDAAQVFAAATVRAISYPILIQTKERTEIHDLTSRIRALVQESGIREGMVSVSSRHTTTAVVVNESQAALLEDLKNFTAALLPRQKYYRHNDPTYSDCERHNADAHLKAMLLGQSTLLPIIHSNLHLGQWQSVLFAEFDGPQARTVHIYIFGTQAPR